MAIQTIDWPRHGRVYYLSNVEETQLVQVEEILGADFAKAARYYPEGKRIYTGELPSETKQNLEAAGYKTQSALHLVI